MLREVREIVSANIKDILLLLGCHGLPSLKMGLVFFFFLLGCHGLPSLKMGLVFFSCLLQREIAFLAQYCLYKDQQ